MLCWNYYLLLSHQSVAIVTVMENENALHRCLTEFMLDTCCHKLSDLSVFACFVRGCITATLGNVYEIFLSGSSAEFYIEPMLSCIGDIDMMMRYMNSLAIPAGHTTPTEVPAHFQRRVTVYEIIDSQQPGYVYLKPSYILTKDDNGRSIVEIIENNEDTPRMLLNPDRKSAAMLKLHMMLSVFPEAFNQEFHPALSLMCSATDLYEHGPALQQVRYPIPANRCNERNTHFAIVYNEGLNDQTSSFDFVFCILCPRWPTQAADWPTRSRIHSVPDQTTVTTIVNNGCDVVGAVHPSCRQDEWVNTHQWRLSFSRAEVTLLNNWTPVQQIIYHVLRFVMKREVLSKTNDNDPDLPTLSNYHIKTLMLWECEQKPPSWWSAESSLIKLCSSLLHKLSDWVAETHCEHYFISNCNLIDRFVDNFSAVVSTYDSLEQLANESFLLQWFVENYIRKCAESCPAKVSALFEHAQFSNDLVRAVRAVADWKLSVREYGLFWEYFGHELVVLIGIEKIMNPFSTERTQAFLKELQNFDLRLHDYYAAVRSMHAAYTISIHSLSEDLLEILWMLFAQHTAAVGYTATSTLQSGALLSISKAIHLARLSSDRSDALEMLHNEMSKAYLHHSFTYGQESTYCVVHVLLAVLYYNSGHYQSAIDHCKQALNKSDSEPYNLRCIGAEYLPEIDENVDAVFGLILLYHHIQREALKSIKKSQPDTLCLEAFTTQLLARYLYSRCSTVATTMDNDADMYRKHLSQVESPLLSDVMLFKAVEKELDGCQETPGVKEKTVDDGSNGSRSMDTSLLVTALELVALEKLIRVRQVMVRELHSNEFPVVNEFEALYAYKCGLFAECTEMCRNGISGLLRSMVIVQLYPVAFPEMLCLLDGEMVSLFGVIRLLNPSLFTGLFEFPGHSMIHVLTLLLYLMVRCHKHGCNDSNIDHTMSLIRYVHDEVYPADDQDYFLDRLVLRLTYRSLKLYIKTFTDLLSS